jgi:hypothetical protein
LLGSGITGSNFHPEKSSTLLSLRQHPIQTAIQTKLPSFEFSKPENKNAIVSYPGQSNTKKMTKVSVATLEQKEGKPERTS